MHNSQITHKQHIKGKNFKYYNSNTHVHTHTLFVTCTYAGTQHYNGIHVIH